MGADHPYTAADWPIAAAMLPFPATTPAGVPVTDAPVSCWAAALAEVAYEGFTDIDLTDSWVQAGRLSPARLSELAAVITQAGLRAQAISVIRCSVIDPADGTQNLAYSHRAIDAAAALGCSVVSVGLHRPLLSAQRRALWFWTAAGPRDDENAGTWDLAVSRLRELARHAGSVGIGLSLEMYEDTLLGSADSAVRLAEAIGPSIVGLNPDLGNLYRLHRNVEPFLESLAKCLPYTNYWHVKSYYRLEDAATGLVMSVPAPMRSGSMDYRSALRAALEAGFAGPFCVEHYGGDGLSVMASNRDYLRHLLGFQLSPAALSSSP